MQLFLVFGAGPLSLAAASIAPAPAEAKLPDGWAYLEDIVGPAPPRIQVPAPAAIQRETKPKKCIEGCIKSKFKDAGCGSATHWDCLCRSEGLAKEVQYCARDKCKTQEDIGSLKFQNYMCLGGYEQFANRPGTTFQ